MRLPTELFDLIIDHVVDAAGRSDGPTRNCALVSRAFAHRSQTHLFASIVCWRVTHFERLHRLLCDSPHLGTLYIRSITLYLQDSAAGPVQLLPYLTNLTRLELSPDHLYRQRSWSAHSAADKSAVLETLALPSLRSLSLICYDFENAVELDGVLGHATSLKELSFHSITLADTTSPGRRPVTDIPRVVLDSLSISDMDTEVIHALLSSFRAVDITRLRSLDTTWASLTLTPLLAANAHTVQEVRCSEQDREPIAAEVLSGNTTLRVIHIQGDFQCVAFGLRPFGDLRCLQALETVVLNVTAKVGRAADPGWAALDALLGRAGAPLRAVVIRAFTDEQPPDAAIVRSWLPQVSAEIFVQGMEYRS